MGGEREGNIGLGKNVKEIYKGKNEKRKKKRGKNGK
jgi:hypothetical protein